MTEGRGMKVNLHVGLLLIHRGERLGPASGYYTSQGDTGNH